MLQPIAMIRHLRLVGPASLLSLAALAACSSPPTGVDALRQAASPPSFQRTIVFLFAPTSSGEDLFLRGGVNPDVYARTFPGQTCAAGACSIPIRHRNAKNGTTNPWKSGDNFLDWTGAEPTQTELSNGIVALGTPADWTTNYWPPAWGEPAPTVASNGYGVEPLNQYGAHYWMVDVDMDCARATKTADGTAWFDVQSVTSSGVGAESDVAQAGAPYQSVHHIGKCGQINVFRRGEDAALFSTDFGGVLESGSPLPAIDQVGIDAVKTWASKRVATAQSGFSGVRMGSPGFWANEVVYSLVVDRFNDGNPFNNNSNIGPWQRDHQDVDQDGLQDYFHGGDLQGIIDRLDYLSQLGITSLWITPVLKGTGEYHGYCASDFTQVDPNFGTNDDLVRMVAEAHKRGIRIVLDIVINHMCSVDTGYDGAFDIGSYSSCINSLEWKHWNGGAVINGQRPLAFGPKFFPPFRNQEFFSRCGNNGDDYRGEGAPALFGDFSPAMFDFNTMNWDFQQIFTDLHKYWIAAADVDGFRMDAAKHITEDFVAKFSTDIRAYAKSIGKDNFFIIGEVASNTTQQAYRVGKMRSDWINPADPSATLPATLRSRLIDLQGTYLSHGKFNFPGLNAIYDFGHSGITRNTFRHDSGNQTPLNIKQWFWDGGPTDNVKISTAYSELQANQDTATDFNTLLNWNVLEIHDWPRFANGSESLPRLMGALGYLLSTKGTPVLYYGVEQGFNGNCPPLSASGVPNAGVRSGLQSVCASGSDALKRQDMFKTGPWRLQSIIPSIDSSAWIGLQNMPVLGADPFVVETNALFAWIKALIDVRQHCTALRLGQIYFRAADSNWWGGLLAFSRIAFGEEIVVLVNASDGDLPVTSLIVDAGLNPSGRVFRNLFDSTQVGTVQSNGTGMSLSFSSWLKDGSGTWIQVPFTLQANGVAIFVKDDNITTDPGATHSRCKG